MAKDILAKLEENSRTFSKGQRLIARYITDNYDKAAFMTAASVPPLRAQRMARARQGSSS